MRPPDPLPIPIEVLERILPRVTLPGRYVGGESGSFRKSPDDVSVRLCLAFPEVYEIGMSHLGMRILHHLANQRPDTLCERVFAPWPDMEQQLVRQEVPLYSLESHFPLNSFHVIGFSLLYELTFSNMLQMLELGRIPLRSADRGESDPIIIAGGPSTANPEPVAPFVDAFVLGDGESALGDILDRVRDGVANGDPRATILEHMAGIAGVYVPALYQWDAAQPTRAPEPLHEGIPQTVRSRVERILKPEFYPSQPLVSTVQLIHDRLPVELMRGCPHRCRFCSASAIYHPSRERPAEEIVREVLTGLERTGYEEVSLLSLSTSDYSQLGSLLTFLQRPLREKHITLAFPSLRLEHFTPELLDYLSGMGKSGLTFAPEAGTDRLRRVLNKPFDEARLLEVLSQAFSRNWTSVKLYFMLGLPTETDEDLEGIISLIERCRATARRSGGNRNIHVTLSPFVPKAHTPFQWHAQLTGPELDRRTAIITRASDRGNVKIDRRGGSVPLLEGILSRGDRRLAEVIERAYQLGARFDGWTEWHNWTLWESAMTECGLTPDTFVNERAIGDPLPWDHLSRGYTPGYLASEAGRALQGEVSGDCEDDSCATCRGCDLPIRRVDRVPLQIGRSAEDQQFGRGRKVRPGVPQNAPILRGIRVAYAREEAMRWASHLDLIRAVERAVRRAGLPIAYSEGFNRRPKLSFGPSLPVGVLSRCEYFQAKLDAAMSDRDARRLAECMPQGLRLLKIETLPGKEDSLQVWLNRARYSLRFGGVTPGDALREAVGRFLAATEVLIDRTRKGEVSKIDLRPLVQSLDVHVDPAGAWLEMVLRMDGRQQVRPQEVVRGLGLVSEEDEGEMIVVREALWHESPHPPNPLLP